MTATIKMEGKAYLAFGFGFGTDRVAVFGCVVRRVERRPVGVVAAFGGGRRGTSTASEKKIIINNNNIINVWQYIMEDQIAINLRTKIRKTV